MGEAKLEYSWPLQGPAISRDDRQALAEFVLSTPRFTQGEQVERFEHEFAAYQGRKHAVYVNSGSSANLLLVDALQHLYGCSTVMVPCYTWPTTVNPIIQLGMDPLFVDIDPDSLGLRIIEVDEHGDDFDAIFLVHLLGRPAAAMYIADYCLNVGSKPRVLIEDCCESLGATGKDGTKVGNYGLAGTFSFYWGHHITSIEGGMVCTDDDRLDRYLRVIRSHGLVGPGSFDLVAAGYNFRNTEINAFIGRRQLERVDEILGIRKRNKQLFNDICSEFNNKVGEEMLQVYSNKGESPYCLPFIFNLDMDEIRSSHGEMINKMRTVFTMSGIESRPLLCGNLNNQAYMGEDRQDYGTFIVADTIHSRSFYIGNNQFVTEDDMDRLRTLMLDFVGGLL